MNYQLSPTGAPSKVYSSFSRRKSYISNQQIMDINKAITSTPMAIPTMDNSFEINVDDADLNAAMAEEAAISQVQEDEQMEVDNDQMVVCNVFTIKFLESNKILIFADQ